MKTMVKWTVGWVTGMTLLWVTATGVWAQDPPPKKEDGNPGGEASKGLKIGFANIKEIIDQYARTKTLEDEIDKYREKQTDAIEVQRKKRKELADELKMLNRNSPIYTEKWKEARRIEMNIKLAEEELKFDLQLKLLSATREIYEDITREIKGFAEDKGYSVIFKVEKGEIESESKAELILKINSRGVLHYDKSLEISGEIIKIMNEKYTGKKSEEGKKEGEKKEGDEGKKSGEEEKKEGEDEKKAGEGEKKAGEGEKKAGEEEKKAGEGDAEKKPPEKEKK
ncbi:MAG: OmpH/Skp family outer membrane protein [Planctomycetota bacterium]|jgi:Skp family chaperone for outer membrane proteins